MRQLKVTKSITNRSSESLNKYLQDISRETMVTPEEEVDLAKRIKQGDEAALDKLVRANLRFVVSVAKKYQNAGLTLNDLINEGRLSINENEELKDQHITYHDSCYLGRANQIYTAPRELIQSLQADLVEMERHKQNGLCCGAGGAQMFKEPEKGNKDINIERTEDAIEVKPNIIATGCPFCMTMMTDGVKATDNEEDIEVLDIAELIANAEDL